jgi:Zn-dependent protease
MADGVGNAMEGASRPGGLRLGRIAGVEVRLDWSLAIIFWLIVANLGGGLFPARHPEWSPALAWSAAILAALAFFGSVLAHELAHAVVGRAQGVPIQGITLFVFGGVAHMRGEPGTPRAELLMTIVGPLTSLVIGVVASLIGAILGGRASMMAGGGSGDPMAMVSHLGPLATLFLWLGSTNLLLAVFNLIPGYPLDGGRVLRAAIWAITGDVRRATRAASVAGRLFGILFIAVGVTMGLGWRFPILGGGLAQGLWLVFIGWFLHSAAVQGYRQLVLRDLLSNVPVSRLMRPGAVAVSPQLTINQLVDDYIMRSDQRAFPVVVGDELVGIVCLQDVQKTPREQWATTRVDDIMTPRSGLAVATPDEPTTEALQKLAGRDVDQLPVVEGNRLRGILRRADVLRWLELNAGGATA